GAAASYKVAGSSTQRFPSESPLIPQQGGIMLHRTFRSVWYTFVCLLCLTAMRQLAQAGPPLICHPFEIANAQSLPWSNPSEWRAVKGDYDLNRLVNDTLALLTPNTPVIVRMETMRRATVYAVWAARDREVG